MFLEASKRYYVIVTSIRCLLVLIGTGADCRQLSAQSHPRRRYPTQRSKTMFLEASKRYYVTVTIYSVIIGTY
jgi:hypothetical protein